MRCHTETVGVGTFFEASHFGGRKTIFDVKKITYIMYLCAISGMSREMMEMDGRDSAECQNWEKKGCKCHFWNINDNKTKF